MTKKKQRSRRAGKKAKEEKEKQEPVEVQELHPEEVRKGIAQLVEKDADALAKAVISQGMSGQLATVKYLFEVANIYPSMPDEDRATADEECLAKTLLRRLDLPQEPVVRDEEDPAKPAVVEKVAEPVEEVVQPVAAEVSEAEVEAETELVGQ